MNRDDIPALGPTTDLATAAGVFGISRATVYDLARNRPDELPFKVLRLGTRYRVPTASILKALDPEVLDGVDWRAKYEEQLAHSRRWEAKCKANLKIIRQLTAATDYDLPDSA